MDMTTAMAMVAYPLAAAIMDRAITIPITEVIMAGTTGITIPGPATMFMTVEANAIGGTKIIADTGKDAATGEPVIMGSALAASINGVAAGVTAITATVMRGHPGARRGIRRSEEHTSELQSLMRISYAVFCLKKKKKRHEKKHQT